MDKQKNYNDAPDDPNNEIAGNWQLSNYNIYPSFYTIKFKSNHKATIVYEPGDSPEKANESSNQFIPHNTTMLNQTAIQHRCFIFEDYQYVIFGGSCAA